MDKPGSVLKSEREKQSRTLEEVSRKLKVKIEYLEAIEDDNYTELPPDIYTKAYLRLYAELLGLEGGYILSLYKPDEKAAPVETAAPAKENIIIARLKGLSLPGFKPLLIILGCLLIILSITAVIRQKAPDTGEKMIEETKEAKVIEDGGEVEKEKEEEIIEKDTVFVEDKKTGRLSLRIEATELTWVSVRIDEGDPQELLLRTGEAVTLEALDRFAVKVGNAGGTRLIFNDKDIGKLGGQGKIVDIVLP